MTDISSVPKSCSTCEHRKGAFDSICTFSGFSTDVERRHPSVCGRDYRGWQKRLSVMQRLKFWLIG